MVVFWLVCGGFWVICGDFFGCLWWIFGWFVVFFWVVFVAVFCVVYGGFFGYLGDRIVFFGVFLGDSFMIHDFQGYV